MENKESTNLFHAKTIVKLYTQQIILKYYYFKEEKFSSRPGFEPKSPTLDTGVHITTSSRLTGPVKNLYFI